MIKERHTRPWEVNKMNLAQRLLIAGTLAFAGCAGSAPSWPDPAKYDKLLVAEDGKVEQPQPKEAEKQGYISLSLDVSYTLSDKVSAGLFAGYKQLIEKTENKKVTQIGALELALHADKGKDGVVNSTDVNDSAKAYAKEKGIVELKLPFVQDASMSIQYAAAFNVSADQVARFTQLYQGNAYQKTRFLVEALKIYNKDKGFGKAEIDELAKKLAQ
jgi:hypothetical protein